MISGLNCLDAFFANMAHPQGQSVIAQEPFVGIEIDRIQHFVGGIMKSAWKMRMISENSDVFRSDPKLQFNFFWLIVHYELLMPAGGIGAAYC
jgi:hypothetical protein